MAAAQLVALHSAAAALHCREQLASAERLMMPALTLFFCLSQVSGPVAVLHCLEHMAQRERLRPRCCSQPVYVAVDPQTQKSFPRSMRLDPGNGSTDVWHDTFNLQSSALAVPTAKLLCGMGTLHVIVGGMS